MVRQKYDARIKPMAIEKVNKNPDVSVRVSWELRGSNPRPSACKADALNQLS
jgi:hypothetical protein